MSSKEDQINNKKQKPSIFSRCKREVSKSLFFFTAGAVTSAIAIFNRRRKKHLKERYKKEIEDLKAKK